MGNVTADGRSDTVSDEGANKLAQVGVGGGMGASRLEPVAGAGRAGPCRDEQSIDE